MPLFRIETRKQKGIGKMWSNDWIVETTTLDVAASMADAIVAFEVSIHSSTVTIVGSTISTLTVGDRVFRHNPLGDLGDYDVSNTQDMAPWNCVRLDFTTTDSDPGHKYLRYCAHENHVNDLALDPARATQITAAWASLLTNVPAVGTSLRIGKNHKPMVSMVVSPFLQMRQTYRRRKAKPPA